MRYALGAASGGRAETHSHGELQRQIHGGVGSVTSPKSGTNSTENVTQLDRVTIRFAGDSGDGMQLTGSQFTATTALFGNDVSTLPDFPAEIRAPAGSLPGVSGFQISFSSGDIHTPGDRPDVLVATWFRAAASSSTRMPSTTSTYARPVMRRIHFMTVR
jgi:hypothetical protein